jgi:uncharacterized surface protein with fasciclin (FAS1) repeats
MTFAIATANLQSVFDVTDPLTVFAASNEAFDKLGGNESYINLLLTFPRYNLHLRSLVLAHGTEQGAYFLDDLVNDFSMLMLMGEETQIVRNETGIFIVPFAARLSNLTGSVAIPAATGDSPASNGVLHEVNSVLAPAWYYFNLVDILLLVNVRFSTFYQLWESSGLVDELATREDTTLIAPTNDAFAALPNEVLEYLLDPANVDDLRQVLLYHFLPATVNFEILPMGETVVTTFQNEDVTIRRQELSAGQPLLFFNDAEASFYFLTTYSILYQVDQVLFPDSLLSVIMPSGLPLITGNRIGGET